MDVIGYAAIGCSGMGRRHLHGLARLLRTRHANIQLEAVCDLDLDAAEALAHEAEALTGARPRVYTSIADLVRENPGIKAADVATDAGSHKAVVIACLEAGLHVLCEKPLAVTVGECRAIAEVAARTGRIVSVAENFRRDPMNRLVRALLDDGAIGPPRLMIETSIGGRDAMVQTPWRHQKHGGMVVIDSGVHNADIIRYYLGEVVSVFGEGRLHEAVRRVVPRGDDDIAKDKWWRPRADLPPAFEATGDDATYSQIRFKSGAICQWVMDRAGHGEIKDSRVIYGATGSITAPGDRNGRPIRLHRDDGTVIDDERILDLAPSYRLSPIAAELFGSDRPWSYDLPFDEADQNLLALQFHELAECALTGRSPEVTAQEGMADIALAYAPIESGRLGRPVTLDEVMAGTGAGYQDEIDQMRRKAGRAA